MFTAYAAACAQRAREGRLRRLQDPGHNAASCTFNASTFSAMPLAPLLDFSSNDYLGLSRHPQVLAGAQHALQRYGAGATGSRLLSGDYPLQYQFEQQIARTKNTEAALIFVSGYQANATALAALLDHQVLGMPAQVFSDRLNHASLHHACRLAGVRQQRYRHLDLNHLESLLTKSDGQAPRFIVSETVFGMDGDQADVQALSALAQRHHALLYLDDAHATGIFGAGGYGLGQNLAGQLEAHTVVMGTFSKALGASGAYLACSQNLATYLLNHSTGFVYSTAPAPAVIGAAQAAWQLLPGLENTRQALLTQAKNVREQLQQRGLNTGHSSTHIIPVLFGDSHVTVQKQQHLLSRGVKVSAVRPPTVPPNTARLRVALTALHSAAEVEQLVAALVSTDE